MKPGIRTSWEVKHFRRRSRLEVIHGVLTMISEGTEGPTRTMSRSNLTWPLTIVFLGVLLKNRMIAMESRENRRVHQITLKESSLPRMYTDHREAAGALELDNIDLRAISKAIPTPHAIWERTHRWSRSEYC